MSEEESSEKGEESLEETSSDYDVLIPRLPPGANTNVPMSPVESEQIYSSDFESQQIDNASDVELTDRELAIKVWLNPVTAVPIARRQAIIDLWNSMYVYNGELIEATATWNNGRSTTMNNRSYIAPDYMSVNHLDDIDSYFTHENQLMTSVAVIAKHDINRRITSQDTVVINNLSMDIQTITVPDTFFCITTASTHYVRTFYWT